MLQAVKQAATMQQGLARLTTQGEPTAIKQYSSYQISPLKEHIAGGRAVRNLQIGKGRRSVAED